MKESVFTAISDDDLSSVSGGVGAGNVISSGSFSSNTGTGLNIIVFWNVSADGAGQRTLNVTVSSSSYSLYCTGSAAGVELNVNGMVYVSGTPAINYSGNTVVSNALAGFSIPNLSGPVNMTAIWHFNGTYSNTPIGDVRASGSIVV